RGLANARTKVKTATTSATTRTQEASERATMSAKNAIDTNRAASATSSTRVSVWAVVGDWSDIVAMAIGGRFVASSATASMRPASRNHLSPPSLGARARR